MTAQDRQKLAETWRAVPLRIGYPAAERLWEPIASPGHMIRGRDILEHAQRHFDTRGEHYLTVRISGHAITSRPVLDDETMADLPLIDGVVEMRLVKLI